MLLTSNIRYKRLFLLHVAEVFPYTPENCQLSSLNMQIPGDGIWKFD